MNYIQEWPVEGLVKVAEHHLSQNSQLFVNYTPKTLCNAFARMHKISEHMLVEFKEKEQMFLYVTPKTYLDALDFCIKLNQTSQEKIQIQKNHYISGLNKIQDTYEQIQDLQNKITELQPILQNKTSQLNELISNLTRDQL